MATAANRLIEKIESTVNSILRRLEIADKKAADFFNAQNYADAIGVYKSMFDIIEMEYFQKD